MDTYIIAFGNEVQNNENLYSYFYAKGFPKNRFFVHDNKGL